MELYRTRRQPHWRKISSSRHLKAHHRCVVLGPDRTRAVSDGDADQSVLRTASNATRQTWRQRRNLTGDFMSAPTDGMPEGNFPGGPQPSPEGPAPTSITQPGADTLAEMRRQVVTLKAEVDALQIASAHQRRSQWLQSSTILAVVGVLITASTSFTVSGRNASKSNTGRPSRTG